MGPRGNRQRPEALGVARDRIVATPGHAFYSTLEHRRTAHHFDPRVAPLCRRFYPGPLGQPSLAPGVSCRGRLLGDCEGLDSERGIAWRGADARSLRKFLGYGVDERTPDHATLSRTRRLWWTSTQPTVLRWVLARVQDEGRLTGPTIGSDATTVAANAAMRSIVRRDTGATAEAYLTTLAQAAGRETPTREALARFDRQRKQKGSHQDWQRPADPDARSTRRTDGRTHLAHQAEPAVDWARGARRAITLPAADLGDTNDPVRHAARRGRRGDGGGLGNDRRGRARPGRSPRRGEGGGAAAGVGESAAHTGPAEHAPSGAARGVE